MLMVFIWIGTVLILREQSLWKLPDYHFASPIRTLGCWGPSDLGRCSLQCRGASEHPMNLHFCQHGNNSKFECKQTSCLKAISPFWNTLFERCIRYRRKIHTGSFPDCFPGRNRWFTHERCKCGSTRKCGSTSSVRMPSWLHIKRTMPECSVTWADRKLPLKAMNRPTLVRAPWVPAKGRRSPWTLGMVLDRQDRDYHLGFFLSSQCNGVVFRHNLTECRNSSIPYGVQDVLMLADYFST